MKLFIYKVYYILMDSNQKIYRQKYLKYKKKYLSVKTQIDELEGAGFLGNIKAAAAKGVSNLGKGFGIDPARSKRTKSIKKEVTNRMNAVTQKSKNKGAQKILDTVVKAFKKEKDKQLNEIYKKAYTEYKSNKPDQKESRSEKEARFKGIFDGLDPVGQLGDIETQLIEAYEIAIKNAIDKNLKKVSISLNEDQIANIKTLTGLGGLETLLNISKGVKALDILKKQERKHEAAENKAITQQSKVEAARIAQEEALTAEIDAAVSGEGEGEGLAILLEQYSDVELSDMSDSEYSEGELDW
jgi:hypothetical protein